MRTSLLTFLEGDSSDPLSCECLMELLSKPDLCPGCIGPASRAKLQQIYRKEARAAKKGNSRSEGLERLVASLGKKREGRVRIYDFTAARHYTVFVDPLGREVLGVLRYPNEKMA